MITDSYRDLYTEGVAYFSDCHRYRYLLSRVWGNGPLGTFVMLNPSTADAQQNDPTVERCERRARYLGWGGLTILNLFALRSTDPKALYSTEDPVGPDNDRTIQVTAHPDRSTLVICAWGEHGKHLGRSRHVLDGLRGIGARLAFLKLNQSGEPAHPLYLPYNYAPQEWRAEGA